MPRFPMTKEGESSLIDELKKLKSEDRSKVIKAIAEAREYGDLKENAEYHAAKEQQSLIESRIREIESKLADSQVIEVTSIEPTGKVIFGTTVTIKDLKDNKSNIFKIVGEDEAEVAEGKISVNSPLSRALIGKAQQEVVKLETPSGIKEYEIIAVEHL